MSETSTSCRPVIICAGGLGVRMQPVTDGHNKHLLPIGNETVVQRCVRFARLFSSRVAVVTSGRDLGSLGRHVGEVAMYRQFKHPGVAGAIRSAETFCAGEGPVVLLADNLFCDDFMERIVKCSSQGTCFFSYKTTAPQNYGVVYQTSTGVRIVEKPEVNKIPRTRYGELVGAFSFDSSVWSKASNLSYSNRNELEVTDLLNMYLDKPSSEGIRHVELDCKNGWWYDIGQSMEGYYAITKTMSGLI